MKNFSFLQKYYSLQKGIMFDKLFYQDFGIISYSKIDKSVWWNNVLISNELDSSQIHFIEQKFAKLKRKPAIYFENSDFFTTFKNQIEKRGYSKEWEDSWMFWSGGGIAVNAFRQVKKVMNDNDLKIYLDTFNEAYQKNDPQNPYGELGDYLTVAENTWHDHHKTNRVEYFIIYNENDEPVAVSTITNYKGIGYISNVGSIRKVRGKGYGKLATLHCVSVSMKNGNKEHCLATEEGTYPNKFYKRIGFITKFTTVGYTKNI